MAAIGIDEPTLSVQQPDGSVDIIYSAQPYQLRYHESNLPNLLLTGPRGTGKSLTMRMDSHMKSLAVPGFRYLTLRRQMTELKKSHLSFINNEMERLGGYYHKTDSEAHYPNGSVGWYGHCETEGDIEKHLGGQYDQINFDEATTFPKEMFLKITACARVPEGSGRIAMIRGGTNPIGVSADFIKRYFMTHVLDPEDENITDYEPEEWGFIDTRLSDNKYIDEKQYRRRLSSLPEHVRRAWLDGEWVDEGSYFADFRPMIQGRPWHVVKVPPTIRHAGMMHTPWNVPWVRIYRGLDWGYHPDPCVCLWMAVLPNGQAVVFKERHWKQSNIADIAKDMKRESEGYKIVDTFCDPTLFTEGRGADYSLGELFENAGIPLTKSLNNRETYGYAIHEYLNTLVGDTPENLDRPKLVLLEGALGGRYGCPTLIRTIQELQMDKKDPRKVANGNDHWVVALAYFCMGQAPPSHDPKVSLIPRYLLRKKRRRRIRLYR